jgi:hypothetical protein
MQDRGATGFFKGFALGKGNVGRVYPAIMKMDGVALRVFSKFPDTQLKTDKLFAKQIVENLLCFYCSFFQHARTPLGARKTA